MGNLLVRETELLALEEQVPGEVLCGKRERGVGRDVCVCVCVCVHE